jgi:hypothetical protein
VDVVGKTKMTASELTFEELSELQELLKDNKNAWVVYYLDEDGSGGYVVEFDNHKFFRGVMHPRVALDLFREKHIDEF